MTTPFIGGNTITQKFGERPEYYKQFGLAGHEGIDLIPKDSDRTIYCIEDGVVVRDVDNPNSGPYGIYCVIWNEKTKRAWWYCHASVNNVSLGQVFKRGDKIAVMGGTGNVSGDHLHLGLRTSDINGNAINLNNGYLGFINPLPTMNLLNNMTPIQEPDSILVPKTDFEKMVNKSDKWDKVHTYLELIGDPKDTSYEDAQRVIAGHKSRATDLQNQLTLAQSELNNERERVSRLKEQVIKEQQLRIDLSKSLNDAIKKYADIQIVYEGRLKVVQGHVDAMGKEKGELHNKIAELEVKLRECHTIRPPTNHSLFTLIARLWQ